MMRFAACLLAQLSCLFLAVALCAANQGETETSLARLQALTASIETLRCNFTQTTSIPLFSAPITSEGKLLFKKPDSLVWEYRTPLTQGLVLSGRTGYRWEGSKAEKTPFATSADPVARLIAQQMLAWIRFDRGWIESHYSIQATGADMPVFVLTPKSAEVRTVVTALRISFSENGVAREIVLQEASGGSTSIMLFDVAINVPVDSREFQ